MEGKMMMTLSRKIKELRNAIDMTQNDLADELGIALKTLQRYETGQCKPDFFALSKLATFFDVSADYLLGICSYEMENKISLKKPKNRLYKRYIACRNNYTIEKDAVYYWICSEQGRIGGVTKFVAWVDEPGGKERRVLREIDAQRAIDSWTDIYGKPMVLNSKEDVSAFLNYGGHAIIRKDICEKYASWYLQEYIVEPKELRNTY